MSSFADGSTEAIVNTNTTGNQSMSTVTGLADGGWVVTWTSPDQDSGGLCQQRYDAEGDIVGFETSINIYTTGSQFNSSVTGLADGGWVITWTSVAQDGSGDGIYQLRYDAQGDVTDTETRVNTYTMSDQASSAVTALADGGWVVTWTSAGQDGSNDGVYQQRYDAAGDTAGAEIRVNTYTTSYQKYPCTAALADGGWVVTWTSVDQDGSGAGIYQQRYDTAGDADGAETRVNSYTTGSQASPSAAALSDGGWIVTWTSSQNSGFGVYEQRFDSDGSAAGAETLVNTNTAEAIYETKATALADGGWVVVWSSYEGDGYNIYQQRYNMDGDAMGGQTLVNTYTTGDQSSCTVAALADGGWVVTWSSGDQDGSGYGVYERHFAPDMIGDSSADKLAGTNWDETLHGLGGNDRLDGRGGDDILIGGFGDDTYIVNSSGDEVEEFATQGTDKVLASISYTLANAVENLTLTGKASIDGTGNALANIATGNAGANKLSGLAGADILSGGKGNDVLTGGDGADTFVYATGFGKDTIKDFENGTDYIDLSKWTGIDNFAEVKAHLSVSGNNLVIQDGADTLILHGVHKSELDASDFIF